MPVWQPSTRKMAEGAAILDNVDYEIKPDLRVHEMLNNRTGLRSCKKNLETLGSYRLQLRGTSFRQEESKKVLTSLK